MAYLLQCNYLEVQIVEGIHSPLWDRMYPFLEVFSCKKMENLCLTTIGVMETTKSELKPFWI